MLRWGPRWLALPLLAGAMAALGAELAMACSCAPQPAREGLRAADAALVGVVTARRVAPIGEDGILSSGDPAEVDLRVERAFKGVLGEQVTVHTVASGATCGLEVRVGQRVGLFLQRRTEGGWTSSLCSIVDPAELAQAAQALPRPNGRGPVRFLLGGGFGGPTVVALDAQGRTLAYGAGRGTRTDFEVCPGGRRAVETAWIDGRRTLYVRDLRSMLVRYRVTIKGEPLAASCRTPNAHGIVALVAQPGSGGERSSRLVALSDRGTRVLHRGSADEGSIEGRYAWLASGTSARTMTRVDLRTGRARRIVSLAALSGLVASPDGRRAAFRGAYGRLCVASGVGAITARPEASSLLTWADSASLVARSFEPTPTPIGVLDSRLRRLRGLPGLDEALVATGAAGRVYVIADDRLYSARARRGGVRRLGRVVAGGTTLAVVGGATRVSTRARQAFASASPR